MWFTSTTSWLLPKEIIPNNVGGSHPSTCLTGESEVSLWKKNFCLKTAASDPTPKFPAWWPALRRSDLSAPIIVSANSSFLRKNPDWWLLLFPFHMRGNTSTERLSTLLKVILPGSSQAKTQNQIVGGRRENEIITQMRNWLRQVRQFAPTLLHDYTHDNRN